MTVAYESYYGKALEAAITLVANSATFASLITPAVSTTPKQRIVELSGGIEERDNPLTTACTGDTFNRKDEPLWAHVWPEAGMDGEKQWVVPNLILRSGSIPVALYFRPSGITLEHELLRYVLGKTSLIAREIETQAGQSGRWQRIVVPITGLQIMDLAGYARGTIRSSITIQYGDTP